MRFSAITALCAAPLALAGSLHADLVARGAVKAEQGVSEGKNNGADTVIVNAAGSSTSITEVIIIWVNPGNNAATTTVNSAMSVAGTAAASTPKTTTVTVGGPGGFVYTPESVSNMLVGDMVEFVFLSVNHTVTQSGFETPCEKLAGGMDSGFMPNANGTDITTAPKMAMQVTVTTPLWFYCRQKSHCGKGMVFSINAKNDTKTFADFKQLAVKQNGTGTTAVIAGGTPAASATLAATASPAATMATGSGTLNSQGACSCSCLCGVAAFPNAAQGLGAFGGISGAMPLASLEA